MKGMRRLLIIILGALLCLPQFGCRLFFEKHSNVSPSEDDLGANKVFSGNGYSIVLTDQFAEKKSQVGFDGYYVADYCGVMVQIVTPANAAEYNVTNTRDLLTQTMSDKNTELIEADGLVYYHYVRNGNAGWNFAFKGSENYYLIQFLCLETSADTLKNTILTFARSVTVE